MRRVRAFGSMCLVLGGALGAAGCGTPEAPALDQWVVAIGTDAPTPQFGDRLLIEVLKADGSAYPGSRREFSVADPADWPVSFGLEPDPSGAAPRVRVRLYRTIDTGADGPASDRIIDSLVQMPAPSGITQVGVALRMACYGQLSDLDGAGTSCWPSSDGKSATVESVQVASPLADPATLPTPGTWPNSAHVMCKTEAPPGMVCIPGGLYLAGYPKYVPLDPTTDPAPEQLVQLSPFFLDLEEFTVARMRPFATPTDPLTQEVGHGRDYCSFTSTPTAMSEGMSVNCVSRALAEQACEQERSGGRLPSEVEWEWAAGNLEEETPWPWTNGSDDPCANAIVAVATTSDENLPQTCLGEIGKIGPTLGGHPNDLTKLMVHNLGGNLSEWTSGAFAPYTDDMCWGQAVTLHTDPPSCGSVVGTPDRGGSWVKLAYSAHPYIRDYAADGPYDAIGFRCAQNVPP